VNLLWSNWSAVRSFTVDTTGPSAPALISPANGAAITDSTPLFDWSDSTGSPTLYQLQVDDNADFSSPTLTKTSSGSTTSATTALANGTYYWRVRARDALGNWGEWSVVYSFSLNAGGAMITPSGVHLSALPIAWRRCI
jgi:hypothetical protein